MPNTFLIKIHSEKCPGQIAVPKAASEWEGGWFGVPSKVTTPRGMQQGVSSTTPGDTVYVWVHERERGSNGKGLSAKARLAEARAAEEEDDIDLRLGDIQLVKPNVRFEELLNSPFKETAVGHRVHKDSRSQTLFLSEEDVAEWHSAIDTHTAWFKAESIAYTLDESAAREAVRERIVGVVARAGQGRFRARVMQRYDHRCAVSGATEPEVLEAAHIVPYKASSLHRDDPLNGVCLRADLHKLFDAGLMWFEDSKVVISSSVTSETYRAFDGLQIDPAPIEKLCQVRAGVVKSITAPTRNSNL